MQVEERLVNNFLMARFMSSALVQRAGNQWMVNADRHGAGSWQCLLLDHIYKTALDKVLVAPSPLFSPRTAKF